MSYEDFLSRDKESDCSPAKSSVRKSAGTSTSPIRKFRTTMTRISPTSCAKKKSILSEILISTEGKDAAGMAAAEKKAKQISSDAAKGQRFTDLARDNSDASYRQGRRRSRRLQKRRSRTSHRRRGLGSAEGLRHASPSRSRPASRFSRLRTTPRRASLRLPT